MKEITNKSLAALLVVAIIVSVVGTWLVVNQKPGVTKTTGAALFDTGTASMNIETTTSIKFSTASVSWGSVKVDLSNGTTCTLNTDSGDGDDGDGCASHDANTAGLVMNNDGNNRLKVELSSDVDASGFIGGTGASYEYKIVEGGNCGNVATPTDYTTVPTSPYTICDTPGFNFIDESDSMTIHLKVVVPYDATADAKNSTWTATGTAI